MSAPTPKQLAILDRRASVFGELEGAQKNVERVKHFIEKGDRVMGNKVTWERAQKRLADALREVKDFAAKHPDAMK